MNDLAVGERLGKINVFTPYCGAVNRFICGRQRVAVARYRIICLVPLELTVRQCLHFFLPINVAVIYNSLQNFAVNCQRWSNGLKTQLQLGQRGVAGSSPGGDIYFHFECLAFFLFLTAVWRWSPCKWNQAGPFTCSVCCFRPKIRLFIQTYAYLLFKNLTVCRHF